MTAAQKMGVEELVHASPHPGRHRVPASWFQVPAHSVVNERGHSGGPQASTHRVSKRAAASPCFAYSARAAATASRTPLTGVRRSASPFEMSTGRGARSRREAGACVREGSQQRVAAARHSRVSSLAPPPNLLRLNIS